MPDTASPVAEQPGDEAAATARRVALGSYQVPALGKLYREVAEGRRTSRVLLGEGARLEALLNATGNAVLTADAEGCVASLNHVAETLFQLAPGEAIGWPMRRLLSIALDMPDGDDPQHPTEAFGLRPDGTKFPIELSHAHWTDALGRPVYGAVLRDVTQRHLDAAEARRRETAERTGEKMAALGRVAAGVAHEMNNLLQPIIGLTEMELELLPPDGTPAQRDTRESLEMVIESGKQMRGIARKILMFSRDDAPELTRTDFPAALRQSIAFVGKLVASGVRIDEIIGDEVCGCAFINQVDLTEVITNLMVNAAHAMHNHGCLAIRLRRLCLIETSDTTLGLSDTGLGLAPGDYFLLSITDNGDGMDAATKMRIFDPFFTTKPRGEGTGLGLSAVFGVLRGWKGAIVVDSMVGRGTTFTLYIPVAMDA
jgi:signal transduction histidine kinase